MRILLHSRFWLLLGLIIADILFFGLTRPDKLPSFALIVGFLLLSATLYCLFRDLLVVASWYGIPLGKHRFRLAKVGAGLCSGLLALQSIGELGSRDVLVLLPFTLLAYVYFSYRSPNTRSSEPALD